MFLAGPAGQLLARRPPGFGRSVMDRKFWGVLLAFVCAFALAARAEEAKEDAKPEKVGKASEFKGKSFDIKEKGQVSITLSFEEGKKATLIVKGKKKSDINLYIYAGKKELAKDDSEGPDCEINWTPKKTGNYTVTIKNLGPGDNSAKLTIKVAD
jgi:hypothetical protein